MGEGEQRGEEVLLRKMGEGPECGEDQRANWGEGTPGFVISRERGLATHLDAH